MFRRFRLLRILKWAGTLACLLTLGAFIASTRYDFSSVSPYGVVGARNGVYYAVWGFTEPASSWQAEVSAHPLRISLGETMFDLNWQGEQLSSSVWLPIIIALLPTLLFWYLDRRRLPPNHCRNCRYNLTANTTNRCPECGAVRQ